MGRHGGILEWNPPRHGSAGQGKGKASGPEHDPQKSKPLLRQDHAQAFDLARVLIDQVISPGRNVRQDLSASCPTRLNALEGALGIIDARLRAIGILRAVAFLDCACTKGLPGRRIILAGRPAILRGDRQGACGRRHEQDRFPN